MNHKTLGIFLAVVLVLLVAGPMGIISSTATVAAIGGASYAAGRSKKRVETGQARLSGRREKLLRQIAGR